MQISKISKKEKMCVLLLPLKVHADVKNDWQYRKAKMATKPEMYIKWACFSVLR